MLTPSHTGRIDSPEGALAAPFALPGRDRCHGAACLYRFALSHSYSRWHEPDECLGDIPLTGNQGAEHGQFAAAPVRRNRLCVCSWPALRPSARAPLTANRSVVAR